jgi:hypothetical protein
MRDKDSKRVTVTLTPDEYERLKYWADRREMSINEYLLHSISHMIAWENQDFDVPVAVVQRVNQMVDLTTGLRSDITNLQEEIHSMADSLLNLTRGDNYLLEEEDGEL